MNIGARLVGWISVVTILAVGLLIHWNGLFAPGFWWTDESRHAMHGAFFVDFLRDLPFQDPYDYVQRYFAQYPALAFNWYLPLFPVIMGLVMTVFGVSEISAHATVTGVWLLGVLGWYGWLVPRFGRLSALAASLALLSVPVVVLWSRSVMLEAPAVALCGLSVFFFQRYLDRPGHVTAIVSGLVLFTTLLVKQTTLFILPVLLAYALATKASRLALWRKESWWGVLWVAMALCLIALHALKFGPTAVMSGETYSGSGSADLGSWKRWATYGEALYTGVGPFIAVLAMFGLTLSLYALYRGQNRAVILPFAWLVISYVWCTYLTGVPGNSERYAFYAMPAIALFAAYGIYALQHRPLWKRAWTAMLLFAAGWQLIEAVRSPHRYVSGYDVAARTVYELPNNGTILFAGKHDGNFIFHLRRLDQKRQRVVLRGDKTLVSMSVHKYFGIKSHVNDVTGVQSMLNEYGVRWILVESRDLVGLNEFKLLDEALRRPGYRLAARIQVSSNVTEFKDVEVLVYENTGLSLPQNGLIRINYPYLGKSYQFAFPDAREHYEHP